MFWGWAGIRETKIAWKVSDSESNRELEVWKEHKSINWRFVLVSFGYYDTKHSARTVFLQFIFIQVCSVGFFSLALQKLCTIVSVQLQGMKLNLQLASVILVWAWGAEAAQSSREVPREVSKAEVKLRAQENLTWSCLCCPAGQSQGLGRPSRKIIGTGCCG